MKTLLVPVDFSAVSEGILDTVTTFARALGSQVVLLHVVPPQTLVSSEYTLPIEVIQTDLRVIEQAAHSKLATYQERLQTLGLDSEALVRQGPPVEAILEEADRVRADLIVMGSHGHGRLYDLIVGSTANGVLKRATCGVLIMPPADKHA